MISSFAWITEFILEALGFYFFFRRKLTALWIWLGFRMITDLATCVIQLIFGQQAYNWADYIQRNAQYLFLAAVCVACVSQILREHHKTRRAYQGAMCALLLIGIIILHAKWPPSADKVLLFEVGAELFLAGFIALALANGRAPRPWGVIAVGLMILATSDATVSLLAWRDWTIRHDWSTWQAWASWYPAGAIPALAILCWAGWKDHRLEEFRRDFPVNTDELPERKPVQRATELRVQSRMVN